MSEAIKMLERRHDLFPAKFQWQGRIHEVEAVNECQTVGSDHGFRTMYHFWVRCNGQYLHLCEDLASGDWQLFQE